MDPARSGGRGRCLQREQPDNHITVDDGELSDRGDEVVYGNSTRERRKLLLVYTNVAWDR